MVQTPVLLRFLAVAPHVWERLGTIPREGWLRRGIKCPESVRDHTLALLALAQENFGTLAGDSEDLFAMLLIHDWPEVITGDIPISAEDPEEKKRLRQEKFQHEMAAMIHICGELGKIGDTILALWLRFETSEDPIANLARQLDKYHTIERALEYEKTYEIQLFEYFVGYYDGDITLVPLRLKIEELKLKWEAQGLHLYLKDFPMYQMKVNGQRQFLSLLEAGKAYHTGFADVKFGRYVMTGPSMKVRKMTGEDKVMISNVAERYSDSK